MHTYNKKTSSQMMMMMMIVLIIVATCLTTIHSVKMAPPAVGDAGYRQISNLKSQKSFNFELGVINSNFEDKYGLTFETAAFRTVERNRPVKSSLRTTGTGSTLKNIGTTFTDGVEFSANWDQSKYSKN